MTTTPIALASGNRVPVLFTDKDGTPCLRVPLDDRGENFATIERQDYDHITRTLGIRAAWYLGGARGRRQYVRVNVPHMGDQDGGHFLVVRLMSGVGPEHRVRYATSNTLDLRRSNLIIEPIQDGRYLDAKQVVVEAVRKGRAAKPKRPVKGRSGR